MSADQSSEEVASRAAFVLAHRFSDLDPVCVCGWGSGRDLYAAIEARFRPLGETDWEWYTRYSDRRSLLWAEHLAEIFTRYLRNAEEES
jgi:hypothetical protein